MAGIEEFLFLSDVLEMSLISFYFNHEYVCLIMIELLPFRKDSFYIYMFCVCVCADVPQCTGEVRGQLSGVRYLLLYGFQELNTGHKTWQQVALTTELSCWPGIFFYHFNMDLTMEPEMLYNSLWSPD